MEKKKECREVVKPGEKKYKVINDFRFKSINGIEKIYDREMDLVRELIEKIDEIRGYEEIKDTKASKILLEMRKMFESPGSTRKAKDLPGDLNDFREKFFEIYENLTGAFYEIYGIWFLPGG